MLRGLNRQLSKRIKQLEKQFRIQDNEKEDIQLELEGYSVYQPEPKKTYCPKCAAGEFKIVIDLADKSIYNCTECDFKKVVKK